MKKIYITFGGSAYDKTTQKIVNDAPKLGADEVWVYDDVWVTHHPFYKQNKWLWEHEPKHGFGWCAWKPLIILDALSKLDDGDIVLYTDADTFPVRDISVLYETCAKEGMMLFEVSREINLTWCKRDCFIVMGQDKQEYHESKACVARFMLFQKGRWEPYQILMEWLTYCINPFANTFDPSTIAEELPGFKRNQGEQAILGLLAHKYGYKLYREADGNGELDKNDRDLYDQLFAQVHQWTEVENNIVLTAPVEGSIYRNVPFYDQTSSRKKITVNNKSSNMKRASGKVLGVRNSIMLHIRRLMGRYLPLDLRLFMKKNLRKIGFKV